MRSFRHADQRSRAALHVGEGVVDRGVGAGLVEDQLHESTLRSSEIQSLRAATGLVVGPQQILALLAHGRSEERRVGKEGSSRWCRRTVRTRWSAHMTVVAC